MNPDDNASSDQWVIGSFRARDAADAAMGDLMTSGFSADEVRLVAPADADEKHGAERAGKALPGNDVVPHIAAATGPGGISAAAEFGGGFPLTADSGPGGAMSGIAMLQLPDDRAQYFSDEVRGGHVLIAVRAGERAAIARTILERNGGETSQA